MPPKQIPPTAPNPVSVNPATAAAIAAVAASTAAAKKTPLLKRKSSTGSTDSKPTVKKKKTVAKAAKPGAEKAKAKDDKKKTPPAAAPIVKPKISPTKATTKAKLKPTAVAPPQLSKASKIQQTKNELAKFDSIERAFQQDSEIWSPPESTGGWMYRTGTAGIGSQSYLKALNQNDQAPKGGILFDETALLQNALRYNNLTEDSLTPQAYKALLEQARRYALELLVDAQDYAQHASRSTVASLTPSDVKLAAELRGDASGVPSTLPNFEEMAEYALEINRKPLPPIPSDCYNGVALPPREEQLTSRTYDIVNGARIIQKMMRGGDMPLDSMEDGLSKRSSNLDPILAKKGDGAKSKEQENRSYGAEKGRQIAIHLKSSSGGGEVASAAKSGSSKSEPKNKRKLTEL